MASTSNPDTHESCRKASIKIRMMCASVSYWNSKFIQCLANPTYIHCYPHCLFFLELLQNLTFRNAMAHPANKVNPCPEDFSSQNNWLKHIFPRSVPEAATAPPSSAPPASLPSSAVPAAPPPPFPTPVTAAALSPMQYDIPPGSGLAKTDLRNASVDPRKRKKMTGEVRCFEPRRSLWQIPEPKNPTASATQAEKEEVDLRSIYVGNVDYACLPGEVKQHFQACGTVNRVTILTDKLGQPKGFAYVEFFEMEAVQNALLLNESELHGRKLKVSAKRTNVPGMKQFRGRRFNPYAGFRPRRAFVPGAPAIPPFGRVPRFRRSIRYRPY